MFKVRTHDETFPVGLRATELHHVSTSITALSFYFTKVVHNVCVQQFWGGHAHSSTLKLHTMTLHAVSLCS